MTDIEIPGAARRIPESVVEDTPCRKCRYNLRGLPGSGRCPECGTPVALSIQTDLLQFSDPDWINSLRTGINCIIAAVVISLLGGIGAGVLAAVFHTPSVTTLLSFVASVISLVGSWLLTAPDPSGLGEDKYGRSRRIIRVTLFIAIGSQLSELAQQAVAIPPPVRPLLTLLFALAGIAGIIGQFATLNYLGKLAWRLPDEDIAARARFLTYAFGTSYGVLTLFGIIGYLSRGGGGIAAVCIAGGAVLAVIIFAVMYLIMLGKLGGQLRITETYARELWERGSK